MRKFRFQAFWSLTSCFLLSPGLHAASQHPVNLQQRRSKPLKSFFRVHQRRHRDHILRCCHLHLKMVFSPQCLRQLFPVKILCAHRGNYDLRRIPSGHSPIFPTDFPVQNLKYLKSFHPLHKALQSFLIPDHLISSVPIHIPDAPLHPSHKKV